MAGPKTPRADRIFWSETEYAMVVDEMLRLRTAGKIHLKDALEKAMLLLPKERRRPAATSGLAKLSKLLTQRAKAKEEARLRSIAPPPPVPANDASVPSMLYVKSPLAVALDEDRPTGGELIAHEVIQFGAAILAGIVGHPSVREAFRSLLTGATPDDMDTWRHRSTASNVVPMTAAPRLPKVLIAGLIGPQVRTIQKEFASRFDLRFWSTDKSSQLLRDMASACEVAVGFTNFLGHPHDQILKTRAPQYVRAGGGVTKLSETLMHLEAALAQQKDLPRERAAH